VIEQLKRASRPSSLPGMKRFGIRVEHALGVSIPDLRKLAKTIGKNHALAQELWATGIHEARILAAMIDDPRKVAAKQMDHWVREFDSWDLCDQCCMNLFDKTPFAYRKALTWSRRREEFVKRAGFALMACLAVHDKQAPNEPFEKFLVAIERESYDDRNFVMKAVNWALRQIGKRNRELNRSALKKAREIQRFDSKSAKWVASDAIRELTAVRISKRLDG
jgi:3-methyladenine DNA glycosylase AlkD